MAKRAATQQTSDLTPAEARRREITTTSARLFDQHGVDRVSMDDVAKAVGLAKPTLYHYFSSKEQILYTIHRSLFDSMLARLEERLATKAPPDEQLLGMLTDTFESMHTHPGHTRVFFEHFRRLDAEYQAVVRKEQRKYERLIRRVLQDGVDSGLFRDLDPELASLALFGMAYWAHNWYSPSGKLSPTQVAETFYDYFVNGIGGKQASGTPPRAATARR